jgi:hypothetical protein
MLLEPEAPGEEQEGQGLKVQAHTCGEQDPPPRPLLQAHQEACAHMEVVSHSPIVLT